MAQSESESSDYPSHIEKELHSLEKQSMLETSDIEVGDTVCAVAKPTVEALVIARTVTTSGVLEFLLLVPPYKKKGEEATPAAVLRKSYEKIPKRKVRKFAFPLPKIEKWRILAIKNKTDFNWTTAALQTLNSTTDLQLDYSSKDTAAHTVDLPSHDEETIDFDVVDSDKKQIHQLRKKVSELQDNRTVHMNFPLCTDSDVSASDGADYLRYKKSMKRGKSKTKRRFKKSNNDKKSKKHLLSSIDESTPNDSHSDLSTSSSSSSDDSFSYDKFVCPFSRNDTRGSKHLKAKMKGRKTERKYLRLALQNLYGSFHSLKCVVNDVRAQSIASGNKPLTFDLIWLEQHAMYLDTLLFDSFKGVWRQWNEPVLDQLTLAFLELLVRVSPRKEYSDHLDERVRKWMKRKRIGLSQRFGPVPAYLQQAKITEAGIVIPTTNPQKKWVPPNPGTLSSNFSRLQQEPITQQFFRNNGPLTNKPTISV